MNVIENHLDTDNRRQNLPITEIGLGNLADVDAKRVYVQLSIFQDRYGRRKGFFKSKKSINEVNNSKGVYNIKTKRNHKNYEVNQSKIFQIPRITYPGEIMHMKNYQTT